VSTPNAIDDVVSVAVIHPRCIDPRAVDDARDGG